MIFFRPLLEPVKKFKVIYVVPDIQEDSQLSNHLGQVDAEEMEVLSCWH